MKNYLTNGKKCYIISKCKANALYTPLSARVIRCIMASERLKKCGVIMAKNLQYGIMLDVYGSLLTQKQLEIMQLYYDDDLSLSEIGEQYGISRQGVHDSIKHSEQALDEFEHKLGILAMHQQETDALLSIKRDAYEALVQCRKVSFAKNIADRIIKTLENIDARLAELGEEQEDEN